MRTDIPAFYSEWFMNRIRAKEVAVRNPYYPETVSIYDLSSEQVDCFWFLSKNYTPMLNNNYVKSIIDKYPTMWDFTITPYGQDIEQNVINYASAVECFKKLSDIVGSNRISLRYDPIIFTDKYNMNFHKIALNYIIKELYTYTHVVYFSFVTPYKKVMTNLDFNLDCQDIIKKEEILEYMVNICECYDMIIRCCPSKLDNMSFTGKDKIDIRGCMLADHINKANNTNIKQPLSKNNKFDCTCIPSKDIGCYNSCYHNCTYCYANAYPGIAKTLSYNPNSIILCDTIKTTDKITHSLQKSYRKE